jgi:putative peptide zinc metalloprotease protein
MLAVAALASMVGWPIYRLGRNIHRRGRLPDMKGIRVTITCCVFAALLGFFFLVPLPVSRVYAEGVVELEPGFWEPVYVRIAENGKGRLVKLYVKDGQRVEKGEPLAVFSNSAYESEVETLRHKANSYHKKAVALRREAASVKDPTEKTRYNDEATEAENAANTATKDRDKLKEHLRTMKVITAPRAGVVMSPPSIDDVGEVWDKKKPLCKIGQAPDEDEKAPQRRLRIRVPVSPADYHLLQADMGPGQKNLLPVDVRVRGMGSSSSAPWGRFTWRAVVSRLPESEAATVPLALSNRAGGPVPIKPNANNQPDQLVPQSQVYLVDVALVEPGADLQPGSRARVKIHCKKQTLAWWVWRTINDTFNLGLM